jgi:hypothetical protein
LISYFRSVLPSRLFLLVLFFLAIQLPYFFLDDSATVPEVIYMLVGERMADGFTLYKDIYDNTAPLSALVYWLIDLVAGRSFIVYRVVAMLLLLVQAILFNITLNRHNVYASKNYLPALLYLLFGSLVFEFNMLSPLLIGNTFIIISLPYLVTVSREGFDFNRLFIGGFILGLAALSYLPLGLFLVVALFAVILFASSTFRSTLLLLCGFAFPYAVMATYFFYVNGLPEFIEMHLLRPWLLQITFIRPPADLAKIMALPVLVLLLSLLRTLSLPQRLVFQVKFQQVMWVWLFISVALIFTREEIYAGTFVLLLPPLAYFGEFLFTASLKKWILSLFFFILLAGVLILRYREVSGLNQVIAIDNSLLVLPKESDLDIKKSVVVVLGNSALYYQHNRTTTPYINWQLAQRHFSHLNDYDAVYAIAQNFKQEPPTYIIDEVGLMPELQDKIPFVFSKYEQTSDPVIYRIKQ